MKRSPLGFLIMLLALAFAIVETRYFHNAGRGGSWLPGCDAELFADGLACLLTAIAIAVIAYERK